MLRVFYALTAVPASRYLGFLMFISHLCCTSLIFFPVLLRDITSPRLSSGLHWLSLQPHPGHIAKLKCIILAVLSWYIDWKKKKSWSQFSPTLGSWILLVLRPELQGALELSTSPAEPFTHFSPFAAPAAVYWDMCPPGQEGSSSLTDEPPRVSINCQVLKSGLMPAT